MMTNQQQSFFLMGNGLYFWALIPVSLIYQRTLVGNPLINGFDHSFSLIPANNTTFDIFAIYFSVDSVLG